MLSKEKMQVQCERTERLKALGMECHMAPPVAAKVSGTTAGPCTLIFQIQIPTHFILHNCHINLATRSQPSSEARK
jgi:hypothetical protein